MTMENTNGVTNMNANTNNLVNGHHEHICDYRINKRLAKIASEGKLILNAWLLVWAYMA